LLHLQMHSWRRSDATEGQGPAAVSHAERAGENHDDGLRLKSSAPLRCMRPSAMACRSPLMTSGMTPSIAATAAIGRSVA
jgi:hypothetical protein